MLTEGMKLAFYIMIGVAFFLRMGEAQEWDQKKLLSRFQQLCAVIWISCIIEAGKLVWGWL